MKRLDADDYLRYHEMLYNGIRDEDLLNDMIVQLSEIVFELITNSNLYLYPNNGKWCDCGMHMNWFDGEEDDISGNGYWKCMAGHIDYYDEIVVRMNGFVTDAVSTITDYYGHMIYDRTIEERATYFELILQFVHARGPMANWFIKGGYKTLSKMRNIQEFGTR